MGSIYNSQVSSGASLFLTKGSYEIGELNEFRLTSMYWTVGKKLNLIST